jgi:membrane dipeptidase
MPRDVRLRDVRETGVRGFVVCALGDANSFGLVKRDEWKHTLAMVGVLRRTLDAAGARIASSTGDLCRFLAEGDTAFILGIEGGNFIGTDLERLDAAHAHGVRLLGLVHYTANDIASIAYGWGGKIIDDAHQTGLTGFGRRVIARANDLGVIVDLAHADERTIRDSLDAARAPMICSHTGPRALQDFPRYISDDAIRAVALAGGIIGLWPFLNGQSGVPDLETFGAYCSHCADVAGVDHIAIGSDVNGVPGYMKGYAGLQDAWKIVAVLSARGFSPSEIELIIGGNFLGFYSRVSREA